MRAQRNVHISKIEIYTINNKVDLGGMTAKRSIYEMSAHAHGFKFGREKKTAHGERERMNERTMNSKKKRMSIYSTHENENEEETTAPPAAIVVVVAAFVVQARLRV